MYLFDASQFGGDQRGLSAALTEAHAEIAALKSSLKAAQERESIWRARAENFERVAARRR